MAIIHRESFFQANAKSYKPKLDQDGNMIVDANGKIVMVPLAWGVMQINYAVWKDELNIDEDRIMEPGYNIELGCRILRQYLDDCNNEEILALNKYWCGSISPPHNGYTDRIISSKFNWGSK